MRSVETRQAAPGRASPERHRRERGREIVEGVHLHLGRADRVDDVVDEEAAEHRLVVLAVLALVRRRAGDERRRTVVDGAAERDAAGRIDGEELERRVRTAIVAIERKREEAEPRLEDEGEMVVLRRRRRRPPP